MTSLKQMRREHALAVVAVAVGLWLTGTVQAKTINVAAGQSIQAAINVAVAGDVVVVAKGTYKERLNFKGKAITVKSTNPASSAVVAATILNGDAKGSVVTFKTGEKSTSVLTGFTITNGSGTNLTMEGDNLILGGGIFCSGSSPTITTNAIRGNKASTVGRLGFGGGIVCLGGSKATISGNTISGNKVTGGADGGCGGGIGSFDSSVTVSNNTISGNTATSASDSADGGGIFCGGSAGAGTITGNVISGNSVGTRGGGGGIACDNTGTVKISGNTIRGNTAHRGGGITCGNSGNTGTVAVLGNNAISGNTATGNNGGGGGINVSGGAHATITNCTISGNSAAYSNLSDGPLTGGGLRLYECASVTISNSIIAFSGTGGGIVVYRGSAPVVKYCDVYGNANGDYVKMPSQTGKNGNISKNPLFAWAAKGNFYEKSKGGRWNPGTKTWVIDTVQSPCINAGNPASAFNLEPAPNGGRINMGAYGNTKYASKSAPKSATAGLLVSAAAAAVSGGGAQITVDLTSAATVQVSVTNVAGREVAVLPQQDLPQGLSTLLWNGKSTSGTSVPAGRYLMRVTARNDAGGQTQALIGLSLSR